MPGDLVVRGSAIRPSGEPPKGKGWASRRRARREGTRESDATGADLISLNGALAQFPLAEQPISRRGSGALAPTQTLYHLTLRYAVL